MNKNDKFIAVAGVIILIFAGIGIYFWEPGQTMKSISNIDEFFKVSCDLNDLPGAIVVSDSDPFLSLIATPVAVNYDTEENRNIIPLYIQNFSNPSRAVTRAVDDIGFQPNEFLDDSKDAKEWSLFLAETYWEKSDAVLLIEYNESGYYLGVIAAPIASYLSIPIIVTDKLDAEIIEVLSNLKVKKTLLCGDNMEGYGEVLRFNCVDDIVDATMSLLLEKFGMIDYITITNPIDAWPPEVLDKEEFIFGPTTMKTGATTELLNALTGGDDTLGTFVIPDDYKYALIKFKGINLNTENVDDLGDNVFFGCGPMVEEYPSQLQRFEVMAGGTSAGGIPVRDSNGNIIEDITYNEAVLYDRGGMEYKVTASGSWLATDYGEVRAEITVEKLSDPIYPMMKSLSAIAPYLTAYHKGLIYGEAEFAFTADDDILYQGEPSPGFYMPRRNPRLTWASNDHVCMIHDKINKLLAKLSGIKIDREYDIRNLQEYYKNNPVYITLVGDATVLPQYIYENSIETVSNFDEVTYYFGCGIPSDFIYGNIDPNPGDWSAHAPDLYSEYPFQENIIGRITGWDIQDAAALVARTVFYEDIINDMGDWKDNAVLQMGGGNDFQKPFIRYKLFGEILGLTARGEPLKMETGASYFNGLALVNDAFEPLDFDIQYIRENDAAYQGFSNEAIDKLKNANLINKLLLSKAQLKGAVGTDIAQGKEVQENSNFILANAHGNQHMFGMGDVGMYKLGLGLPNGILERILSKVATFFGFGPGFSLSDHGYYSTRNVENMDLGPSFLWIESCICGKIDGMYPKQGISQAFLHSGCNTVIAATTTSNVPGGYLEPKTTKYELPGQTLIRYLKAQRNAKNGIYPEQHFGFKIYTDLCEELQTDDTSIGLAFRNARNQYLPEDALWEVWWSPPLVTTGFRDIDTQIYQAMSDGNPEGLDPRLDNKYQSFFEYTVYGDPAFVPYVPMHN